MSEKTASIINGLVGKKGFTGWAVANGADDLYVNGRIVGYVMRPGRKEHNNGYIAYFMDEAKKIFEDRYHARDYVRARFNAVSDNISLD